jgi:hypothetical protein
VLETGRSVEREIYLLLEWYICECILYGPHNLGGWWSDGVIHLEITEYEDDHFKLLGVTWIDCKGIAPFEIDIELGPSDDSYFIKTIFRIGMLDHDGRPKLCDRERSPEHLLAKRPRCDHDWAMAVELTPPGK